MLHKLINLYFQQESERWMVRGICICVHIARGSYPQRNLHISGRGIRNNAVKARRKLL